MTNERKALCRQLQHYFDTRLFGLYQWGRDTRLREPEPVLIERDFGGRRINQRSYGRFAEKAVLDFDGYVLMLLSPNEAEPDEPGQPLKPAVLLYDGLPQPENLVVSGANNSTTWDEITKLLKDNMDRGLAHGNRDGAEGSTGR